MRHATSRYLHATFTLPQARCCTPSTKRTASLPLSTHIKACARFYTLQFDSHVDVHMLEVDGDPILRVRLKTDGAPLRAEHLGVKLEQFEQMVEESFLTGWQVQAPEVCIHIVRHYPASIERRSRRLLKQSFVKQGVVDVRLRGDGKLRMLSGHPCRRPCAWRSPLRNKASLMSVSVVLVSHPVSIV